KMAQLRDKMARNRFVLSKIKANQGKSTPAREIFFENRKHHMNQSKLTLHKFRDVGAVGGVGEGEEFALGFEAEAGGCVEEFLDDVLIFFGFEAAGAIDQRAAGFKTCGGLAQEVELGGAEAVDFFRADAPAEVDTAAHDAGVGAGGVDEDTIEGERREV